MWYSCFGLKGRQVPLGLNVLLIPVFEGFKGIQSVIRQLANGSGGQYFLNKQFRRFFTPRAETCWSKSVQFVLVTPIKIRTGAMENVTTNRKHGKNLISLCSTLATTDARMYPREIERNFFICLVTL